MEQQRRQPTPEEVAEYVRQLAQLTARIAKMNGAQREKYAQKIGEVRRRVAKLTPAMRDAYNEELARLGFAAAAPEAQPAPAADAEKPAPAPAEPEEPAAENGRAERDEPDGPRQEPLAPPPPREEQTPPKKRRRGCLAVLLVALVLFGALCGAGVWTFNEVDGHRGRNSITTTVSVPQGSGPLAIGSLLQENGIIRSARAFQLYVRFTETAATLQYGEFQLSSAMSYGEIVEALQTVTDTRDTVTVTFPEGIPAVEFANRLQDAGLCTAEEFLSCANQDDFSELNFWNRRDEDPDQFMKCEGYLFPDTYEFFVDDDVHNIVKKLYAEFDSKITEEMYQQIEDMGFTLSQFVTLASLVQEEAGSPEHQADVAAVFMNRLAPGSPVTLLQSNCSSYIQNANDNNYLYNTVAWYYGDWSAIPQNIIEAYDTYSTPGLPAGPISNPGLDAMLNTLRYQESPYYGDYYFFVTDTLGNYYFNKTAEAHQAQVDQLIANGTMPG